MVCYIIIVIIEKRGLVVKKRFFRAFLSVLAVICLTALFTSCQRQTTTGTNNSSISGNENSSVSEIPQKEAVFVKNQLRGMWFSYYEIGDMYKSKDGFAASFEKALDKCLAYGINNIYVHVRSHCDAYYKSAIFPWSAYLTDTQGADPQIDPLQIMIELAHRKRIKIHAWINPYRVSLISTDLSLLADNNPAKIWLTDDDTANDTFVVECNGGLYLNPAEVAVQHLVAEGVREIVQNYSVDGIHFDDYFYPTNDEAFDEAHYATYRTQVSSNPLELADWRRANVNAMVNTVYNAVKNINPHCVFGISPMASVENNYHTVYADIKAWLKGGYIDYVMPQLYFGFEYPQESSRFDNLLNEWCALFENYNAHLYIGLGAYRIGSTDEDNIEWSQHSDILSRQAELINKTDGVSGWVMYSYSSFFAEQEANSLERDNFYKVIKSTENNGE